MEMKRCEPTQPEPATPEPAAATFLILLETRKERLANASVSMGMLTGCRRMLGLGGLPAEEALGLLEGSHSDSDRNFILAS